MSLRPPRFCARLFQRRAGRSAAHIAAPAAACAATAPPQALNTHSMMPASRLVRQRFEGRPVVRTPAAPGPALTSHRGEPARWSVRRPVEHVCTAAAPPSPGRATPQGAPGPRHAEKPRRSAGRVGSARSAAPSSIASARTPAPAPAAVAPHRAGPPDSRWSLQVRLLCRIPRPHLRPPCSPAPPLRLAAPPRARPRTRPHIPLERALPAPAVRHAPLPSHPNCRPCSRLSPLSPPILFAPPLAPIPLPSISALSAGRLPSDTYTPQLEFGHSSYVMSSLDWSIYRPGDL